MAAVCNPNASAFDTFLVSVGGFPDEVLKQADSLATALIGSSMVLLSFSFLATVVISGYRNLLGGNGIEALITDLTRAVILAVIALALINNWAAASQVIPSWFKTDVISKLTTASDPASSITQFYSVFGDMFKGMTDWIETGAKPCADADSGIFASLQKLFDTLTLKTLIDVIRLYLFLTLAILIILIPLTIFSAQLLFVLFGNALILKIGIIFGPLALAFMPFAPMAWLAMSWLRFMITTALTLAIAYLVAGILAASMLPVFQTMLRTAVNSEGLSVATLLMGASIALILFFGIFLLSKVDDIASSLVGGGGSGGGGAIAGAAMGAAMRGMRMRPGGSPGGGKGAGFGSSSSTTTSAGKGRAGPAKGGSSTPRSSEVSARAGSANQS